MDAADVPRHRPAGHHPGGHGPRQLGARRPTRQHGANLRHDLPRRRPRPGRTAAVKEAASRRIDKELEARRRVARAQSRKGLAEEQPKAYKNVDEVVEKWSINGGISKVARMRPIGVIEG
ncbi:MAG: RtcB family protein [Gemmataceae bacterium]